MPKHPKVVFVGAKPRDEVVALAVEITRLARYVPSAICLTCRKHVYAEAHKDDGHEVATLTIIERDEVSRRHREAAKAEWEEMKDRWQKH